MPYAANSNGSDASSSFSSFFRRRCSQNRTNSTDPPSSKLENGQQELASLHLWAIKDKEKRRGHTL